MIALYQALAAVERGEVPLARGQLASLARSGDPRAAYHLGRSLSRQPPIDPAAAVEWLEWAAAAGHARSAYDLGALHALGDGVPQSSAAAYRWYLRAADLGDAEAMRTIGLMHLLGQAGPRDPLTARGWMARAVAAGDRRAALNLGLMHERGDGVPVDAVGAAGWYERAASPPGGLDEAHAGLVRLRPVLARMADAGHPDAAFRLGTVAGSASEAARWYWAAVRSGHPEAAYEMSVLHRTGRGVVHDPVESARLCEVAARAGVAPAQHDLAFMLWSGHGTGRDPAAALEWWRAAAAQDWPRAQHDLAVAIAGSAPDEAAHWLGRSAVLGFGPAMVRLGLAYRNGEGVAQDDGEAARWLIQAKITGEPAAAAPLAVLAARLPSEILRNADRRAGGDGSIPDSLLGLARAGA